MHFPTKSKYGNDKVNIENQKGKETKIYLLFALNIGIMKVKLILPNNLLFFEKCDAQHCNIDMCPIGK